ncbi:serine hydrolase [Candidatus Profftia tarda]|uniref:serine hydrolase n=1 Tax=Candidatus Profftia tarda TaxID=1177216 RepID=UPI001FE5E837|nr:serine hydrolase [Candidatus Profftia tarda]
MVILNLLHAHKMSPNPMILDVPQINAAAYILIDYNSGKVLAEYHADSRRSPASLTKMMTSYVIGKAIKAKKITEQDVVTIGKDAWGTNNPIFKGSSLMFLKPIDHVPVSLLMRGINLQSGNDACVAMADYVSGSQEAFIDLMNNYAMSLHLYNTHFRNVHGLDCKGQYTSARDMALLGQALIRDVPKEYSIYKEKEFTFNNIHQINRNGLLWDIDINIDGIKTGHTKSAGFNLVASATQGKMRLISAVLGGKNAKERETESKKLLTWGFHVFETIRPLHEGCTFALEPVWFGKNHNSKLGVNKDVYITIPRGRTKYLKASYQLNTDKLYAPLKKSEVVGTIHFLLDGYNIKETPLVVLNQIQKGNCFIIIADYIKIFFKKIVRFIEN